ncbi:acid phosphatase/Vanadium-dependent haloperoxidase [Xylaria nigripes]|nr:acid phosphatase/Vanadium-dependent haloperoxidase [Xylaria nigripes]
MPPPSDVDSTRRGTPANSVRFWMYSYASDYLGLAFVFTVYLLIIIFVEPFHRMFYINNLDIGFPHADVERVSVWLNIVYSALVPLGLVVVYNGATSASFHKHHHTILGFAIALALSCLLTDIVKNSVGRPRPDLIARCKPAPGTKPDVLVSYSVCTETDHHTLHDGWRSFPSGHSSFSFSGLGYLALFLAGQLRIFRDRKDFGRALVCLTPLVGAAMIAISRCEDYRHDVYDVCVGSLLGIGVAFWSYRRYWPRLSSRDCHEPCPVLQVEMENQEGWRRTRDEEEADSISNRSYGYDLVELGRNQS